MHTNETRLNLVAYNVDKSVLVLLVIIKQMDHFDEDQTTLSNKTARLFGVSQRKVYRLTVRQLLDERFPNCWIGQGAISGYRI